MTKRNELELFLQRARDLILLGKTDLVPRGKNLRSLAKIGLTLEDVWEEVFLLEVRDYYRGPKRDFERPGEIWEFKKDLEGLLFYVKLKIEALIRGELLKCLGFHEDDYPGAKPWEYRKGDEDMERAWCEKCKREVEPSLATIPEEYEVRGERIQVHAAVKICPECQNPIYDEALDGETLRRVYEIYRERQGLLNPKEADCLRNVLGLTQEEFSRFLDLSPRSLQRYFHGSLLAPDQEEKLLRLRSPQGLWELFREREAFLEAGLAKRIQRRLTSLEEGRAGKERALLLRLRGKLPCLDNGFRSFDYEKFCAMTLFFINQGENLLKVKLLKLLNYADFLSFKDYGSSISGSCYIHYAYGPVPLSYEALFSLMEEQGILQTEKTRVGEYEGVTMKAGEDVYGACLSPRERQVLERVYEQFAHYGSAQISNYSHREEGYRDTSQGQLISYAYARNLSI